MSRDRHPTRGTRIHSKGLQSPLEAGPHPTGTQGQIKAPFAGTICSTSFSKPLLFKHWREAHSTKCVEGKFCELRHNGVLGSCCPWTASLSAAMLSTTYQRTLERTR